MHRQEVAHALGLTELNLFRNIRIQEFLERRWEKDKPNSLVYVMVNRFNFVAFWVSTEIVTCANPSQRKTVLERLITIAEVTFPSLSLSQHIHGSPFFVQLCYQMNNFNTTMEILAGLSMGPVARMKKTWRVPVLRS